VNLRISETANDRITLGAYYFSLLWIGQRSDDAALAPALELLHTQSTGRADEQYFDKTVS
jgi:hypothetical protein